MYSGSAICVRAEPKMVTFGTSWNGANILNASRISSSAALAIFRSSVSGLVAQQGERRFEELPAEAPVATEIHPVEQLVDGRCRSRS